jgi:glycosyltransferase involved in cell wall biosynthesis
MITDCDSPPPSLVRPRVATIGQLLHTLDVGGAEILAARLARQLNTSYRFVFFCLDGSGDLGAELRDEGFTVRVLCRRPGVDWSCSRRLGSLVRRERVDLLHAHQYTPFFYGALSRVFGRRVPIVFTEHGRHQPDYPRRKRMLANRFLLRKCDRVIAVGAAVRHALIANEGIAPQRVGIVYNGVPLDRFRVSLTDNARAAVRSDIGVRPDDLVVIQVARLDYLKDHGTAIRTIERVGRTDPRARLVLVGDGPERGRVEALVRGRELGDHVRFLGQRSDVPQLLAASDIVLLTSVSEGIPLTLIEAMGAGRPVVSTRVGGVREVVADGETGLLAPAGDDPTLAEQILRLANEPDLRAKMGQSGRQRADSLFREKTMHDRYDRVYRELINA